MLLSECMCPLEISCVKILMPKMIVLGIGLLGRYLDHAEGAS